MNGQATSPPDVAARRLSTEESAELRIDGLLDERAWAAAASATGFRQREPSEGDPATERTEVRVLFDDATLYIGIHAHDRSPEEIIARILQRDKIMIVSPFEGAPQFTSDDAIAILFDPFHDHRNGVIFGTNANGARDLFADLSAQWRVHQATLNAILGPQLEAFNELIRSRGIPAIMIPGRRELVP